MSTNDERLLVGWLMLSDDILILTSSGLIYFSHNGFSTEETRLIITDNINRRPHEHHIISFIQSYMSYQHDSLSITPH
jgi:hypothetical protein